MRIANHDLEVSTNRKIIYKAKAYKTPCQSCAAAVKQSLETIAGKLQVPLSMVYVNCVHGEESNLNTSMLQLQVLILSNKAKAIFFNASSIDYHLS